MQQIEYIIDGYLFWTIFHAFAPVIWFFPLNAMQISGYEVFVLFWLLPGFLFGICGVRLQQFCCDTICGQSLLRGFVIVALLSFQTPTQLLRLCFLTFGSLGALGKFYIDYSLIKESKIDPQVRKCRFWGHILGFLALLCSRIPYRSITPAWSDKISNLAIIAIALSNLTYCAINNNLTAQTFESSNEQNKTFRNNFSKSSATDSSLKNSILIGLGLGSQLFLLHWCFGEVSVPLRWSVTGFPSPGLNPNPWGLLVFIALCVGVMMSQYPKLCSSFPWSFTAFDAFYVFYYMSFWYSFISSLLLAVYVMSVMPILLNLLAQTNQYYSICFTTTIFTYLAHMFYTIWTVAYNFVPGGVFTREFSGLQIFVCMTTIYAAVLLEMYGKKFDQSIDAESREHLTANFDWSRTASTERITFRRSLLPWLLFYLIISSGGMYYRWYQWRPLVVDSNLNPNNDNSNLIITASVWAYHFGYDNQGWPSIDKSVDFIHLLQSDLIALVETDTSKPFMGHNDLTQFLAERLNFHADFGPATRRHTWGCALLSRYPIISSDHHVLPSPQGELGVAISAVVNVWGRKVGILLMHMGNEQDDLDRKLQAEALSNISNWYHHRYPTMPFILSGYVTSKPDSRDYQTLTTKSELLDIDSTDRSRYCLYIFYRNLKKVGYARISHGVLSDTEVQMAKFQIISDSQLLSFYKSNFNVTVTTDSEKIDPKLHFPAAFQGHRHGHFADKQNVYHMNTPKYFISQKEN